MEGAMRRLEVAAIAHATDLDIYFEVCRIHTEQWGQLTWLARVGPHGEYLDWQAYDHLSLWGAVLDALRIRILDELTPMLGVDSYTTLMLRQLQRLP
jgi:hypothetical protein